MKKNANFNARYDKDRIFLGAYGKIMYLPKVNLLSQVALNLDSVQRAYEESQEKKTKEKKRRKETGDTSSAKFDYYDYKIKVPVPPPASEAMINPRTEQKFPLGTSVDPDTGEELREVESVQDERTVRRQILYADTDAGTIYYVDGAGALATYHVGGLMKISENPNSILQLLDTKIAAKSTFKFDGERQKWDKAKLERIFYVDPEDKSEQAQAHRERLRSMSSVDFDREGGIPLFMYAKDKDFRKFVQAELLKLESDFKKGTAPVRTKQLGSYYAQLVCAVLFADKHAELFADLLQQEEKTQSVDPSAAPEIPHVQEETRFLPHQSYALSFLKDRKTAMIDADPGAGKTLIMLADVIDKLNQGVVRRPVIVMPNSLLSDQKREMESWTKGTMNFIVLNTQTVKASDPEARLESTGRPRAGGGSAMAGMRELRTMIRQAPPNTIILTSYTWIRGGRDDQVQTGSGITFRRANWLVGSGVDMLVLDESHNVRVGSSGKPSKKAQAIMQMKNLIPYKRCYTGTSAPSGPDDVFLQMNFLDPSILGPRKQFVEKYGISKSPGKRKRSDRIEEFRPGAIKEIQQIIHRRAGLSIRRSAWLGQLPQLKVDYHKAVLSVPQRVVYERIMDRILKEELGDLDPGTIGLQLQKQLQTEYANNPVARAQLSKYQSPTTVSISQYDGDEDETVVSDYDLTDESAIARFKKDKDRAIKGWNRYQSLDGEDLVGEEDFLPLLQKFIAVDRFLNNPTSDEFGQHFLFDEADQVSPKVEVIDEILDDHFGNPNNGKVIIFCQYKDVAGHILGSMRRKGEAVYYDSSSPKALDSFKNDDSVRILVAVEQSIREGQNLQMANRIIRVDMPWNPGAYEQAIARSYRLPPRDPDAQRYSVVHIDIILTEGTAEITKFMRMVSKMHKVRQLISGFTDTKQFRLVGMNLQNMQELNTFDRMQAYRDAYGDMREQEIQEAKLAPNIYGTESFELANGQQLEGSEIISTPALASDADANPESIDPTRYDRAVLISPQFLYFNGAFWMAVDFNTRMSRVFQALGIATAPRFDFLYRRFSTAAEGIDLLKQLQQNETLPLKVINANELVPKIFGKVPVDPTFPESVINYSQLQKKAAAPPSDFRPSSKKYSKEILAYPPSQQDLKFSASLLSIVAAKSGKKPSTLQSLAAAKIFGYLDLTAEEIEPEWLWKASRHFSIIPTHKDILLQQSNQPATPSVALETPQNEVTQEPQDSKIPGLDVVDQTEGVPIQLQVSIIGGVGSDVVAQLPAFTITDTSAFTAPGLSGKVISVLQDYGFKLQSNPKNWILLGNSRREAAKIIKKLMPLFYEEGKSYLKDPDDFAQKLDMFGLSMKDVFPNMKTSQLKKMAQFFGGYPDFLELTAEVYGL